MSARPGEDVGGGQQLGKRPRRHRLLALGWSAAEVGARQFITLGFSFGVLAFISPHDLGIFTLAYAINQVPSVLLDDPIIEALIQKHAASTRDWNAGFTANLILNASSFALAVAVGGPIAGVLQEPELRWAVPAVALCSLLASFGYVQRGYLAREFCFAAMAKTMLKSQIIAGVVGVGLAMTGWGYWSLLGNLIAYTLSNGVLFWRVCPWKPKFVIDIGRLRELSSYALSSVSVRCVILVRDSAPPLVVGAFYDATVIGLFALAFRIARTLGLFFEDMSRQPLMALMSREQTNPQAFSRLLLDIVTVFGAAGLPAFAGLAIVGSYIPGLVFGQVWAASGVLLPWLCIIVAGWVVLHVVSVSLRAHGKVNLAFNLLAPFVGLDLVCLVGLAPFGIRAALVGMSIRMVVSLPVIGWAMKRWLGVSVTELLGRWTLPLSGTILMAGSVQMLIDEYGAGLWSIVGACLAGAIVYAAVIGTGARWFDRRVLLAAKAIG